MKTRRLLSNVHPLIVLGLLISCSDEPEPELQRHQRPGVPVFSGVPRQTSSANDDLARLVPADSLMLVHLRSMDGLRRQIRQVVASFRPGAERMVELTPLFAMSGVRERDLDVSRAAAVATGVDVGGNSLNPTQVLILPAKKPQDLVEVSATPASVSGGYVGIRAAGTGPEKPALAAAPPSIARDMIDSDLFIRIDMRSAMERFGPMADMYLDPAFLTQANLVAAPDPAQKDVLAFLLDKTKQFLNHARQLDLAVSLDKGRLDLDVVCQVGEGSPRDGGAAPRDRNLLHLSRSLPLHDAPVVFLVDGSWVSLHKSLMPVYQATARAMPEPERRSFLAMVNGAAAELFKHLGNDMVLACDLTTQGLQAVAVLGVKDAGYIAESIKSMAPDSMGTGGVRWAIEDPETIDGVEMRVFRMTTDLQQMMASLGKPISDKDRAEMDEIARRLWGKDGLTLAFGVHGNDLLVVLGDGDLRKKAVQALKSKDQKQLQLLDRVAAGLHFSPSLFLGADIRALSKKIRALLPAQFQEQIPPVPAGDPVLVWGACGADGARHDAQLHVDLAGIAALGK